MRIIIFCTYWISDKLELHNKYTNINFTFFVKLIGKQHTITESDATKQLLEELKKFDLECLYLKFAEKRVTTDVLWTFSQKELDTFGVDFVQSKKYFVAVAKNNPGS